MRILVAERVNVGRTDLRTVCPNCRHTVVLEYFGIEDAGVATGNGSYVVIAIRRCPNPTCRQLMVTLTESGGQIIHKFPLNRIDFDTNDIPVRIVSQLEEALTCRANNCHIASAIMLRKTLETLCDELGIIGNNLKMRVAQLSSRVILPVALMAGLDDIRLLGNDAAHVESTTFADISPNELDISIAIIKEVLKNVYQYQSLLQDLQSLKKPPTT